MVKHTPGPWHANGDVITGQNYPECVATRGCYAPEHFQAHGEADNWEGNSRLIAAAPDMLAALQECAEVLDNYVDVLDGADGQPRPNRAMSMLQEIERVIAKAGG